MVEVCPQIIYILSLIEKQECIYNKNHPDHSDTNINDSFNSISEEVNKKFDLRISKQTTGDSIKKNWEMWKKGFLRAHRDELSGRRSSYYLYKHMSFFTRFAVHKRILSKPKTGETLSSSGQDHNPEEKKPKNSSSEQLLFKSLSSRGLTAKDSFSVSRQQFYESLEGNDVNQTAPKYSDSATKKKCEEKAIEKEMSQALKGVLETSNRINTSLDVDSYMMPIKAALSKVPPAHLLKCTNGINKIIKKYKL